MRPAEPLHPPRVKPAEPPYPPAPQLSEYQRGFCPRDLTEEDLDAQVEHLRHDKIVWLGVTSDPSRNHLEGIKCVCKVRGTRNNTRFGGEKLHKQLGWLKTTYYRSKNDRRWQVVEDGVVLDATVNLPAEPGDCVQYHYPPECRREYMVRFAASRDSISPKRNHIKRKQPPTPPKKVRLVSRERKGPKGARVYAKEEEDVVSPGRRSSMNSTDAPEGSSSSDDSDGISTPSPLSVEIKEVKEDLDASGFHAVCFMGILDDPKGTARTMSKTQKKVVMKGVLDLNHHDSLFSHCFGLSSFDATINGVHLEAVPGAEKNTWDHGSPESNVVVFTSFPRIFADSGMKIFDVGQNAEHLSQTPDVAELCEGARICVVLIDYDTNEHPINHDGLLRELEMYSDVNGMKILHIDRSDTGRWYEHTNGELVILGPNNVGFTCNDQALSDNFEGWYNDKLFDEVASHQLVEWLQEISKEETLEESMCVAFPAEIQEEIQDDRLPLDDIPQEEDHALADPVEVEIKRKKWTWTVLTSPDSL